MGQQSGGPELLNTSEALERGAAVPALPWPGTAAGCSVLPLTVRPPSELIHLANLMGEKNPTKQNPNPFVAVYIFP